MDQIHQDRLTRLRYLMEQLQEREESRAADIGILRTSRFDIRDVADVTVDSHGDFCPTACCVAGAAMLDPWFNAQGLGFEAPGEHHLSRAIENGAQEYYPDPVLNGEPVRYESADLAGFFGVSHEDWRELTNPYGYCDDDDDDEPLVTPAMVIARINSLMGKYA